MRVAIFTLILFLSSCISYKPILITGIKDIKTTNIGGDKIEVGFGMEVSNPNGFRIVLKQYDMDVSINDKTLGKANSLEKICIRRKSKESHAFKLTAEYHDFINVSMNSLSSLLKNEPMTFKIKGQIKGRVWWFKRTIPIETTQKIKL